VLKPIASLDLPFDAEQRIEPDVLQAKLTCRFSAIKVIPPAMDANQSSCSPELML
jgi:hypothetical protein